MLNAPLHPKAKFKGKKYKQFQLATPVQAGEQYEKSFNTAKYYIVTRFLDMVLMIDRLFFSYLL